MLPQLPSDGRGNYRNFSFANLIEVDVCRILSAAGIAANELERATEMALKIIDPEDSMILSPKQRRIFADIERRRFKQFGVAEVERQKAAVSKAWDELEKSKSWAEGLGFDSETVSTIEADAANDMAMWRRFKNPDERGALRFYLIRDNRIGGDSAVWRVVPQHKVADSVISLDEIYAVNLTPIFARVEQATGDRWRTWKELA